MPRSEHTSLLHYILSCICISFIRQLVFAFPLSACWLASAMSFRRYKDVCVYYTGNKVSSRLVGKPCCDTGLARFRFMTSSSYNLPLPADSQLTARGSLTAKTSLVYLTTSISYLDLLSDY